MNTVGVPCTITRSRRFHDEELEAVNQAASLQNHILICPRTRNRNLSFLRVFVLIFHMFHVRIRISHYSATFTFELRVPKGESSKIQIKQRRHKGGAISRQQGCNMIWQWMKIAALLWKFYALNLPWNINVRLRRSRWELGLRYM